MCHLFCARHLVYRTAAIVLACCIANAQESYFPANAFFPDAEGVNSLVDDITSGQLRAMKEPSLWKMANADPGGESYRVLWLASRKNPVCFRITRDKDKAIIYVSGHDGSPGNRVGRKNIDKEVRLTHSQWDMAVELIEKSDFWGLPVETVETRGLGDGERIVIEGVRNGKYHLIDRSGLTAGDRCLSFCRHIVEISAEGDFLKTWDQFRLKDKKSPDYQPEPPQTEDRG